MYRRWKTLKSSQGESLRDTRQSFTFVRARALLLTLALLLTPLLGLTAAPAQAATTNCTPNGLTQNCTVTFDYTGAAETWTVPDGVTSATFDLYGT